MNVTNIRLSQLVNPTPRQKEFLELIQRLSFVLFGGAAGGGKSFILRWFAVICVLKAFVLHGVRNAKFGLFCEDYPALKGRHLSVWDIPRWMGSIADTKTEGLRFKLIEKLGGGMVMLRNLDDPSKYDSEEFIGIAVDEWCKNPWSVFNDLRKRLRWKMVADDPHLPCGGRVARKESGEIVDCPIEKHRGTPAWNFPFAMGTNPEGPGLVETKAVFIDAVRDGNWEKFPKELLPIKDQFGFVPAFATDNPYNPADYKEKNLDTLPEKMRKAYADGDWETFIGQYFGNFVKSQRQLHPAQIAELIKPWWTRWMSSDWGFNHHWVTQWHARGVVTVDQAKRVLGKTWTQDRTIVITYRELAEKGLSERPYCKKIIDAMPKDADGRVAEKITDFFLGFDAFGRVAKNGDAVGNEIADALIPYGIPRPRPADDARVPGWRLMYGLIDRDEWFLSKECRETIDAIPALTSDKKPEDIEKIDHISDDCGDCARYGLKSMLEPENVPEQELSPEEQEALRQIKHEEEGEYVQ